MNQEELRNKKANDEGFLKATAAEAGMYYTDLLNADVPIDLAFLLVRDYHLMNLKHRRRMLYIED